MVEEMPGEEWLRMVGGMMKGARDKTWKNGYGC